MWPTISTEPNPSYLQAAIVESRCSPQAVDIFCPLYFFGLLCITVSRRKRRIEHVRRAYPIGQIPLEMDKLRPVDFTRF